MQPFKIETGLVASIPMSNVDTDVIMPKQFLKGIDRQGLARGVFHDLRAARQDHPDFALNRPGQDTPAFLVTGSNFGCGSSREHAVWGLMQFGIRAILGTSFGSIFFDNAANNGLLILTLPESVVETIHAIARDRSLEITIDLERQIIALPSGDIRFEIEADRKTAMLAGQDAIARTEASMKNFDRFEATYFAARPWLPRPGPQD